MLARVPSLGITLQTPRWQIITGAITFLKDLKIFRRYSDREWIIIILLSVSYPNFLEGKWVTYHLRLGQGPFSCGVRIECKDPAVLLDFNRKVDICTTLKTVFTQSSERRHKIWPQGKLRPPRTRLSCLLRHASKKAWHWRRTSLFDGIFCHDSSLSTESGGTFTSPAISNIVSTLFKCLHLRLCTRYAGIDESRGG